LSAANGTAGGARPVKDGAAVGSRVPVAVAMKARKVPASSMSNGEAAGAPKPEPKALAKPAAAKPASLKDLIRNKRLAMKQTQSSGGDDNDEAAAPAKRLAENDDTEDSLDARKKRDDAHLSPQKGIPKRRVLDASGNPTGD
jgi:hypothetical protein